MGGLTMTDNVELLKRINNELRKKNLAKSRKTFLKIVKHYLKGKPTKEIAKKLNRSLRLVEMRIKQFKENGIGKAQQKASFKKLTIEQLEELKKDLKMGALKYRFLTHEWSPVLLKIHLEEKYQVNYTTKTCRKLLDEYYKSVTIRQRLKKLKKSNTSVWLYKEIFLGYIEPIKIGNKKDTYFKCYLQFAINKKTGERVCQDVVLKQHEDKQPEMVADFLDKILEKFSDHHVVVLMNKANHIRSLVNDARLEVDKSLEILFFDEAAYNPLSTIEEMILKEYNVVTKNNRRKNINKKNIGEIKEFCLYSEKIKKLI